MASLGVYKEGNTFSFSCKKGLIREFLDTFKLQWIAVKKQYLKAAFGKEI